MGMPGIQNVAELKQCRLLRFICDATLLVIVFFLITVFIAALCLKAALLF